MENYGLDLLEKISMIGEKNRSQPLIQEINIFHNIFDDRCQINEDKLTFKEMDYTYREILARYLLLNAVLDQGPDSDGVRLFLAKTINHLYDEQLFILHTPKIAHHPTRSRPI